MSAPEIWAMPLAISTNNSELVIRGTYGRMIRGASVWPMNTFAATDRVSAPLVPIKYNMIRANARTTNCKIPKWYSTVKNAEMNRIGGNATNANWNHQFGSPFVFPGNNGA